MNRNLELKAELTRHDLRYRDLANRLQKRGYSDAGEYLIARILAGRIEPSNGMRGAIAEILNRPTIELFPNDKKHKCE
jgi:transcriptional regulator with XRE-family HTH domain